MGSATIRINSRSTTMKRMIKTAILMLVALGFVGGSAGWYFRRGKTQAISFRTARVTRGNLLLSIDATGTVEPEEVIDVGAQVAGKILAFGKDADGKTVDYGSIVEAGMILAHIDDSLYSAEAAKAEAQVQSAGASLQRSKADMEQIKAKLYQAERDWARAQKLGSSEALAQASYDAYKATYEAARANVAVGEASILQNEANLAQAKAVFQRAQRNLSYCTIKSPVKGVIIDRRVNNGQTVVASLNAPSLFLLAKDLTRIEVWVAVNEADIGNIHPGQPVTFTVDAFPGETFLGEVGKVRLNASMTQNVVTYTVEVITDNSNGRLLPYLTANVQFELDHRNNVLLVPKAALSWTPSVEQVVQEFRETFENPSSRKKVRGGQKKPPSGRGRAGSGRGVVWVLDGQHVRPVRVRVGLTDNVMTEIEGEGLTEGLEIVTGLQMQGRGRTDTITPFAPKRTGRGRGGK